MKKQKMSKLVLTKDTLRNLDSGSLRGIAGPVLGVGEGVNVHYSRRCSHFVCTHIGCSWVCASANRCVLDPGEPVAGL